MLNRVMLIGNLGKDPEIRYTAGGTAVASFSVATTEKWKDKQGQQQAETEWHNIVVWNKLAEICGDYLKKGNKVYLSGKIKTRKWQDKDGNDRYTTEIVADDMKMLDGKPSNNQDGYTPPADQGGDPDPSNSIPF